MDAKLRILHWRIIMKRYNFYNSEYNNALAFREENPSKVEFTMNFINSMYQQLKKDEEIIAKLKDDLAEREAVKEAREERDKAIEERKTMAAQLYYGLTKNDIVNVRKWQAEHTKEERKEDYIEGRPPKNFHRITYKLYPTELGMIKTVECSCGQILDITKDKEFG